MPIQSKEVWRIRLRLEVGLLLLQIMGFEVKERKDLVLAMPSLGSEDRRMAIKEKAWRHLS